MPTDYSNNGGTESNNKQRKECSGDYSYRKTSRRNRKRKTDRIREKRKRSQDSGWTNEMDELLRKKFGSCAICGRNRRLSKDHLVPLCNGGKLEPGNVVRLCRSCNIAKANKMPNELPDNIRTKLEAAALEFKKIYDELKAGKKIL